jgi:hypothetical protein
MNNRIGQIAVLSILAASAAFSQRPGGPPRGDGPDHHRDWTIGVDVNKDGRVDQTEFQSAIDRTFADLDLNSNGIIERSEIPPHPGGRGMPPPPGEGPGRDPRNGRPGQPPPPFGDRPGPPDPSFLPPFFFMERLDDDDSLTRAEFEQTAKDVFAGMDANHDGSLTGEEARPPHRDGDRHGPPAPPNAMFIAAELRFGDKLVKGQPFSAETLIEDTRRLFDGSTVTKRIQGAIYRDSAGRTRREQPLEMVGGFAVVGEDNQAPKLIFINDFSAGVQYFLDPNRKAARKSPIGAGRAPREDGDHRSATTESLGKKMIDGLEVEGTLINFEIPVGQMGNDKPLQVTTETWISPKLQMIVMSRHVDPISGEHLFRLVNIKRTEPSPDLFTLPAGYKVEN